MGIGKKIKDTWKKLTGKDGKDVKSDKESKENKKLAEKQKDSELAVEEVVEQEIFPEGKRPVKRKVNSHYRSDAKEKAQAKKDCECASDQKPPSKRTRPTNRNYKMIDPDDDSADAGKS
ncbi:MAG: hypothetical protein J1G04_06235 [Clostridiales bacterium]|nr:hypothetical protein [Clostridiales bacterium]